MTASPLPIHSFAGWPGLKPKSKLLNSITLTEDNSHDLIHGYNFGTTCRRTQMSRRTLVVGLNVQQDWEGVCFLFLAVRLYEPLEHREFPSQQIVSTIVCFNSDNVPLLPHVFPCACATRLCLPVLYPWCLRTAPRHAITKMFCYLNIFSISQRPM